MATCIKAENLEIVLLARLAKAKLEEGEPGFTLKDGTKMVGRTATLEHLARSIPSNNQVNGKLMGGNDAEYAEIHQWISYSLSTIEPAYSNANLAKVGKFLNDVFKVKTFAVGHSWSLADLILHVHLHKYVSQMPVKKRFELSNLVRWFDYVQNSCNWVKANLDLLPFIDIDWNVPKVDSTAVSAQASNTDGDVTKKKAGNKEGQGKKGAAAGNNKKEKVKKESNNSATKQPKEEKPKV